MGAIIRPCGFTARKAEYARALGHAELDFTALDAARDDDIVTTLVGLPGIGVWTAECYLLFALGRRDVFPAGDLALRIGWAEISGADTPSERELRIVAERWSPYRTAAAYLVHPQVRVTVGRAPEPGADEVMVGRLAHSRMGLDEAAVTVGRSLYFEDRAWTIVGRFDAPGTVMNAEVWTPLGDLMVAAKRETVSCVVLSLGDAEFAAAGGHRLVQIGAPALHLRDQLARRLAGLAGMVQQLQAMAQETGRGVGRWQVRCHWRVTRIIAAIGRSPVRTRYIFL